MGTNLLTRPDGQSFLLDLLTYAGWTLWVSDDEQIRINGLIETDAAYLRRNGDAALDVALAQPQ